VPLRDASGCPFAGPGVDLRGDEARAVLDASAPLDAWLRAREPGVVLRTLSVDRRSLRVLVTLEAVPRPRVVRFDPPQAIELLEAAKRLEELLGAACARALERRQSSSSDSR
jgi:hypothetical protein